MPYFQSDFLFFIFDEKQLFLLSFLKASLAQMCEIEILYLAHNTIFIHTSKGFEIWLNLLGQCNIKTGIWTDIQIGTEKKEFIFCSTWWDFFEKWKIQLGILDHIYWIGQ